MKQTVELPLMRAQGTDWWLLLTDEEITDLASGYVPSTVRAQCLQALDHNEDDRRRAQRPYRKKRKA